VSVDVAGVHIPCVTPFDPVTGDVDLVGFRQNLRAWFRHPIRGVVVGGSTGEAVLLDESERTALLEGARDLVPEGRLLIAGTGAESTRATLRLCRTAADRGADALLVQPPAFYRGAMIDDTLVAHYRKIADASPAPIILYQVPLKLSTLDLSMNFVEIMARHENVIGIKDSRGKLDLVGELVSRTGKDFQVLVGSGAILYGGLEVGAVGGILGVANMAAEMCAAIYSSFGAGDSREAGRIQELVAPVHAAVVGGMGVPGVKVSVDLVGMKGGAPRAPLRPLADRGRDEIEKVLRAAGLLPG
jgi:dihydrodipicolinate synthase/N-acetylneuraminate lyase